MEICVFNDGSSDTDFVGKQSLYKSKSDFLADCFGEFDWILESYLTEKEWHQMALFKDTSIVKDDGYCRYYPKIPDSCGADIENGYMFCEKGKGAFSVYSVNISDLAKKVKEFVA